MNIDDVEEAVDKIWRSIDPPSVMLASGGHPVSDTVVDVFEGKKFDEINIHEPRLEGVTPLVYFSPEARSYYLGFYLRLFLFRANEHLQGMRPIFGDIPETHAIVTLTEELKSGGLKKAIGHEAADTMQSFLNDLTEIWKG